MPTASPFVHSGGLWRPLEASMLHARSTEGGTPTPSYQHVWHGDTPVAPSGDGNDWELGSYLQVFAGNVVNVRGVRIWNPGTTARASRKARLWNLDNGFVNLGEVRQVLLPVTLPAGWSEHLFASPYVVDTTAGYKTIAVSYSTGAPDDYGRVPDALPANHLAADGRVQIPTEGGRLSDTPEAFPTVIFQQSFYGVDLLYD